MLSSVKEVFAFTKGETIALCLLLAVTLVGGGLVIYDHSRQSLPSKLIFEAIEASPRALSDAPTETASPSPSAREPVAAAASRSRLLQLNINSAPAESLRLLPYIGDALSLRIVEYRDKNGPFDSVGQLVVINGIGKKSLQRIRPYLLCE